MTWSARPHRPSNALEITPELLAIEGWIVDQGLNVSTLQDFVGNLAEELNEAGFALIRLHISRSALDPLSSGTGAHWERGESARAETYTFRDDQTERWQRSPLKAMVDDKILTLRRRLTGPEAELDYPVLEEMRDQGGTDWVAHAVPFTPTDNPTVLAGMIVTFLTDHPDGFTPAQAAALDWLTPRIGLVVFRLTLVKTAITLLDAYIGSDPGRRIISGQIRRGDVIQLPAALLIADLRGFTRLTESTPPEQVVAMLNERLGLTADAVADHGGEVLKFLGDGLLAVFGLQEHETETVCGEALSAARTILDGIEDLNRGTDGPAMAMDLALHLGEVLYGNVGSDRRLDFTTIGPAVNQASRIEALCEPLGQHLLISESFASRSGQSLRSLGRHALRGVAEPQELFTLS